MSEQPLSATFEAPALVVFGLDESGKAHASSFTQSDAVLATKAAALMGMKVLPVQTDAERALAIKLPKGRVFASGKGFVPFVKATLFAELRAAAPSNVEADQPSPAMMREGHRGEQDASTPATVAPKQAKGGGEPEQVPQPQGWSDIQVGAIVLSSASPGEMDWYECVVVATGNKDRFTLRYCDWPNEPTFVRHLSEMGLLHPSRTPEPPLEVEQPVSAA